MERKRNYVVSDNEAIEVRETFFDFLNCGKNLITPLKFYNNIVVPYYKSKNKDIFSSSTFIRILGLSSDTYDKYKHVRSIKTFIPGDFTHVIINCINSLLKSNVNDHVRNNLNELYKKLVNRIEVYTNKNENKFLSEEKKSNTDTDFILNGIVNPKTLNDWLDIHRGDSKFIKGTQLLNMIDDCDLTTKYYILFKLLLTVFSHQMQNQMIFPITFDTKQFKILFCSK